MATKKADEAPTPEDLGIEITPVVEEPETVETNTPDNSGPAPTKRGRGRPRSTNSAPRDRAAPRKSQAKRDEETAAFAKQLVGIHMMAAMATGMPEVAIREDEAEMLAKGITAVAEEYGLALSGKTGAAIQLFGAAAIVYLPRAIAIKQRVEKAKQEQAASDALVVGEILG